MRCGDSSSDVIRSVASDGTTTPIFFAFKRIRVADWARARVSLIVDGTTGNLTVETCARYSNTEDGLPGASLVAMPTTALSLNANGQLFGGSFKDLDDDYQIAEFGVKCSNGSAGDPTMAIVTLTVDLQE